MPYATEFDLVARYGETEIARLSAAAYAETVVIDAARVATALDDASAVMDGYLRKVATLPLDTVPVELVVVCCKLARHALASQGEGRSASEAIQREHDAAMAWLRDVAKGLVELGLAVTTTTTQSPDGARTSDRARVSFGRFV